MEHPFINLSEIKDKSLDDLQKSIMDLGKKLSIAYRMQNPSLINQMNMVLESYKNEYNLRIKEAYKKQNIEDNIKISGDNDIQIT